MCNIGGPQQMGFSRENPGTGLVGLEIFEGGFIVLEGTMGMHGGPCGIWEVAQSFLTSYNELVQGY